MKQSSSNTLKDLNYWELLFWKQAGSHSTELELSIPWLAAAIFSDLDPPSCCLSEQGVSLVEKGKLQVCSPTLQFCSTYLQLCSSSIWNKEFHWLKKESYKYVHQFYNFAALNSNFVIPKLQFCTKVVSIRPFGSFMASGYGQKPTYLQSLIPNLQVSLSNL